MMPPTGSWHCFPLIFMLCTHFSSILAYFLKDCTILYSGNISDGVSVDCKDCDLVSIPDDIPRDVISLTLQYNGIQKINKRDLYDLTYLRDLELSDNLITHVDDFAFVRLRTLKLLHMNNNQLRYMTDNIFQGLDNLLLLSLNDNFIQSINPAAFQDLTGLEELYLNSNQIHQMTDIITILKLPRLQVLNSSIDELTSFQSKDLPLTMSSELRELRADSRSIKTFSITTAVFPHLETIDLSYCCNVGWKWEIPDKYFLRNITKVYFNNVYNTLSSDTIQKALQSLDSLEYLELSHMDGLITGDLLNTVCKIPTLKILNLRYNSFANLSGQLSPCTQLTNLDLSDNYLDELSKDALKQMKQLSHLNLASNQFSKVPDDIKNLSMLKILHLNDNDINDLGCLDFLNLNKLTHLHLDNNGILEIKSCVFQQLNELKVLSMNDNVIVVFGDTFKIGLQKLDILDLNQNSFKELLEGDFKSLKSLKHLDMDSDKLIWLDSTAFEGLDELETLSLIMNVIDSKLPSIFPLELPLLMSLKSLTIQFTCKPYPNITFIKSPQLTTLRLRSNNLPDLNPKLFDSIPNLEVLDLSKNKLTSLDFLSKTNLNRLSWLDLSNNMLTLINVSVLSSLPALKYVNMRDNPFTCDCSNGDIQQWMLKNKQTQVVGAHHYTCGYPLAKKGVRFLDFDVHSCEQMDITKICCISSTCAIVLTLLTSFIYHFLRRKQLYADYLFLAFLYDANKRKSGSPQQYDAFVSYNFHDELWVCREMLPVLEGEQGWRLCLHHRDFQLGKAIIENITEAIYGSRKIICVISHRYLESEWCSKEIQMARMRGDDTLILLFVEDIPAHQLSPYHHMRRLLKRHTYLSWSQAGQHPGLFWQNLRRALDTPHTDLHIDT